MSQGIRTHDDLRDELKKLARRLRTTVSGLSEEVLGNNTLSGFVMRPEKQRGLALKTLLAFLEGTGHSLTVVRPDVPEASLRTQDDVKVFLVDLARYSGKSISGMCGEAGISLSLVGWANGSSGAKTVFLDPLLKLLNSQKVTVKIVRNQPTKAAAKRAMVSPR